MKSWKVKIWQNWRLYCLVLSIYFSTYINSIECVHVWHVKAARRVNSNLKRKLSIISFFSSVLQIPVFLTWKDSDSNGRVSARLIGLILDTWRPVTWSKYLDSFSMIVWSASWSQPLDWVRALLDWKKDTGCVILVADFAKAKANLGSFKTFSISGF